MQHRDLLTRSQRRYAAPRGETWTQGIRDPTRQYRPACLSWATRLLDMPPSTAALAPGVATDRPPDR